MCWWGIWALTISPTLSGSVSNSTRRAQYAALVSPLFTMMYVHNHSQSPADVLITQTFDIWLWDTDCREATGQAHLRSEPQRWCLRRRVNGVGSVQGIFELDINPCSSTSNGISPIAIVCQEVCFAGSAHVSI